MEKYSEGRIVSQPTRTSEKILKVNLKYKSTKIITELSSQVILLETLVALKFTSSKTSIEQSFKMHTPFFARSSILPGVPTSKWTG